MIPDGVRALVEHATGQTLLSARVLHGGLTSDVWWCELREGLPVVAKQFRQLADTDDLLRGEVAALSMLDRPDVPRLLGQNKAEKAIVMSALEGEQVTSAGALGSRIEALASWMVALHEADSQGEIQQWRRWGPDTPRRPSNPLRPEIWNRFEQAWIAIDRPPWEASSQRRVLHRDLHPLNVLWSGSSISGVIDWANACIGHPHADLAHLRWNLAVLVDQAAADQLVEHYRRLGGLAALYDPLWDLQEVNSLGGSGSHLEIGIQAWLDVGRTDLDHTSVLGATERFVEAALDSMP